MAREITLLPCVEIEPKKRAPRDRSKPTVAFTQGVPRRYRFAFEKVGPSAFVSHLDLLRLLPRIFRRLELPLFYSQGFHPKPDLTFGPALSLGIASLCEHFDARITADLDLDGLADRLTANAPPGIRFRQVQRLDDGDPSIAKILADDGLARWVVGVPVTALPDAGFLFPRAEGEAWVDALRREIDGQLDGGRLTVMRTIEGIGKKIDVRAFLRGVRVGVGAEALAGAGVVGDLVPIEVDTALSGTGGVRIGEVVEALLGKDLPHRAVRVAMWATKRQERVTPMNLAALRRDAAVSVAAEE